MTARTVRLAAAIGGAVLLVLLLYASTFVVAWGDLFRTDDPLLRSDVARLAPARVARVDDVQAVEQLQAVVRDARARGHKVSISGSRHSQGGHTYTAGGVVLSRSLAASPLASSPLTALPVARRLSPDPSPLRGEGDNQTREQA